MTFVILGGGGGAKNFQNVIFLKVVFKIHFKLFWVIEPHLFLGENWVSTPILSCFQEF